MRKPLRKKDNIWWNSELASLRKAARRAWRKATKTKQEEDWKAQKLTILLLKSCQESKARFMALLCREYDSQTPTARLVKII